MTSQNNHIAAPLKLNEENERMIVHTSKNHSSFSNAGLAQVVVFERYDIPLRIQIGRIDNAQKIASAQNETNTTYYRDTFTWARNDTIADFGDGKPGVWVLGFSSIQHGSFDDLLHETTENVKSFAATAASHMDIAAVLAGEERKSLMTIARWTSVGRFLETVHTAAKEKIPPTKLIKKLTLARFNQYLAMAELFSGRRSEYHPYRIVKNPVSSE